MDEDIRYLDKTIISVTRTLLPILLILSSVWIVLHTANLWVEVEYRFPGFPADPYGFTLEDRLYWSKVDIAYLLNDAGIEYFDDFLLEDGSPMHNERELRHMQDVKDLIQLTWWVLGIAWLLVLFMMVVIQRRRGWGDVVFALTAGARATLWLMLLLGLGLIAAFGVIFVGFHRIFFEGDTWLFSYSDTFIRLYPERFWRDTFVYVTVITLLLAAVFLWLPRRLLKNKG